MSSSMVNPNDDPHAGHDHPDHSDHSGHPGIAPDEELSYYARRARAMEALLVEKGVCTTGEIQGMVERIEARSPTDGARVVARAWADPEFKTRLLTEPGAALAQLGYALPRHYAQVASGGKHGIGASPGGLHPLFLLPPGFAGPAPGLVQESGLPIAGGG